MLDSIKNEDKYYPMIIRNLDEDDDIFYLRWEKYKKISQKKQDILTSDELVEFIYGVERRYNLEDAQTEEFSRTVRGYFFGEILESGFVQRISTICHTTPTEATQLLRKINEITPSSGEGNEVGGGSGVGIIGEKQYKPEYVMLPLEQMIKKYPRVSGQVITENAIKSKPFLNPLNPTIKNWVIVYEKVCGVSKHSAIERGEFVYRAEATRGLSEEERQRISMLFKSYDEGVNLPLDPRSEEIVFEREVSQQDIQKTTAQGGDVMQVKNPQQTPRVMNGEKKQRPMPGLSDLKKYQNRVEEVVQKKPRPANISPKVGSEVRMQKAPTLKKGVVDLRSVSQEEIVHEQDELQKATSELEEMMRAMDAQVDVRGDDAKQKWEMQGSYAQAQSEEGSGVVRSVETRKIKTVKKKNYSPNFFIKEDTPSKPVQQNRVVEKNYKKDGEKQQVQPVAKKIIQPKAKPVQKKNPVANNVSGDVSFSSNHDLPAEGDSGKKLQSTQQFGLLKPIGGTHKPLQGSEPQPRQNRIQRKSRSQV